MTKQKSNQNNGVKFLDQVYADIGEKLNRYDTVHPFTRKQMQTELFNLVTRAMKQSFKNAIQVGMKRARQKRGG